MLETVRDVEILATGVWNRFPITGADLDAIIQAAKEVTFKPSIKIGHNNKQRLAKELELGDEMVSLGFVENLRRRGDKIVADLTNMPARVAAAVRRKNLHHVSSEIFCDFEEMGRKFSRVLKAVALLGDTLPAVSTLKEIEGLYEGGPKFSKIINFMMEVNMAELPEGWSDAPWADVDKTQLPASCFLYVGDPDVKATWKLPIYEGAGELDAETGMYRERGSLNLNGVKAAYAAVSGARGGVDIPDTALTEIRTKLEGLLEQAKVGGRGEEEDMAKEELEKLKAELEATKSKAAELSKAMEDKADVKLSLKKLEDELARQREANVILAKESQRKDNEAWVRENTRADNMNILPVERPLVEFLLERAVDVPDLKERKFSLDKEELTIVEAFKRLFENRKGNLGGILETFSKGNSQPNLREPDVELSEKVNKLMTEQKLSYSEASRQVLSADADLKHRYLEFTRRAN